MSRIAKICLPVVGKQKMLCIKGAANYNVDCGSGASLDDLHAAAFTVEIWARVPSSGGTLTQYLLHKTSGSNGWYLYVPSTGILTAGVNCATTSRAATSGTTRYDDNIWRLYGFTYDAAGDRKIRLYVNGLQVGISAATAGDPLSDAAVKCYIGRTASSNTGAHGWARISNVVRTMAPIQRRSPPAVDANTAAQWNCLEGSGTALADATANANNGTIANGTWARE